MELVAAIAKVLIIVTKMLGLVSRIRARKVLIRIIWNILIEDAYVIEYSNAKTICD